MKTANSEIEIDLAKLRTDPNLASAVAATRAAALGAVSTTIDAHAAREVERLKNAITEVEAARLRHVEAARAAVETARRARSDLLVAEMFATGAGSLAQLVDDNCGEPSRTVSGRLRAALDSLNAKSITELGAEIDPNTFAAVLADQILTRPGLANALAAFAQPFFGGTPEVVYAVDAVVRATDAASTLTAFFAAEAALLAVAKRWVSLYPGVGPTADQRALYDLRKRNVTRVDHLEARQALEEAQGAARFAVEVRNHRQPDTLSMALRRKIGLEPLVVD
jgi:hypothetical protein